MPNDEFRMPKGRVMGVWSAFLGHLEKQDVGEFGDVLMIGNPVVLEDVAEVPELGDDVVGH